MRVTISQSMRRKIVVLVIAVVGFLFLYEAEMFDSRSAFWQSLAQSGPPRPGSQTAFRGDGVLQGQHDGIGCRCANRRRRCRSDASPCRQRRQHRGRRCSLQRRLHRDGHGASSPGTGPRSVHVELPRGAEVRPQGSPGHRASARMGSDGELARPHRPRVQASRCRATHSSARSAAARGPCTRRRAPFGSDSGGVTCPAAGSARRLNRAWSCRWSAVSARGPGLHGAASGYAVVESN